MKKNKILIMIYNIIMKCLIKLIILLNNNKKINNNKNNYK